MKITKRKGKEARYLLAASPSVGRSAETERRVPVSGSYAVSAVMTLAGSRAVYDTATRRCIICKDRTEHVHTCSSIIKTQPETTKHAQFFNGQCSQLFTRISKITFERVIISA